MCFRETLERDKVTPDVYYKYAPGWSNMGYSVAMGGAWPLCQSSTCRTTECSSAVRTGVAPNMTATPYEFCSMVIEAAKKVPFIKSVPIKITGENGDRDISLEEVKVAFNTKKAFPNLYAKNTPHDRIGRLEAQVAQLQDTCKALWDTVEAGQSMKDVAEPSTVVGEKRQRSAF